MAPRTAVPLDALRGRVAEEEALLLEAPTPRIRVETAIGVRTERRTRCGHSARRSRSRARPNLGSTTYGFRDLKSAASTARASAPGSRRGGGSSGPRAGPVAAIGAHAIGDAFRVRLAALVVRARIVMAAVATGVEIAAAARARVAKPDALAARELDAGAAGSAVHGFHRAPRDCGLSRALAPSAASGDSLPRHAAPRLAVPLAIAVLLATPAATAQTGASTGPDAVDLALAWARGGYASPVVCRFGERVQRGIEPRVIAAGPAIVGATRRPRHVLRPRRGRREPLPRRPRRRGAQRHRRTPHLLHGKATPFGHAPARHRAGTRARAAGVRDRERSTARGVGRGARVAARTSTSAAASCGSGTRAGFRRGAPDRGFCGPRRLQLDAVAPDGTRLVLPLRALERR